MNRFFFLIAFILLTSCQSNFKNSEVLFFNDKLIENEFSSITGQYLINPQKSDEQFKIASLIKEAYDSIFENYKDSRIINTSDMLNLLDIIEVNINPDSYSKLDLEKVETENIQILQIQLMTLNSISKLEKHIHSNDYAINEINIETKSYGDKLKIIIEGIDTTSRPMIILGQYDNFESIDYDTNKMAKYYGNSAYFSKWKIRNLDELEGTILIKKISGDLDMVKFRKEIK